jgi:hypothetical protein
MKFKYIIVGRVPGTVDNSRYEGIVDASAPKMALVAALADQFGDKDDGEPYAQLTQSGWCDEIDFDDQWGVLCADDSNFCLDTGDHTYDVVVEEVKDPDGLVPLVVHLDDLKRPKNLTREALEEIADYAQSFLFRTNVGSLLKLPEYWTTDKDVSGADFVDHMNSVLDKHGLVPDRDYPVVD